MKKLIAASLSLAMLFSLTACGSSKDDDTPIEKPSAVATQAKTEATTSDVIQYDPFAEEEFSMVADEKDMDYYVYPSKVSFDIKLEKSIYNVKIVSADTKVINVKAIVDEDKLKAYFKDEVASYNLIEKEKTYSFNVDNFARYYFCSEDYTNEQVEEITTLVNKSMDNFGIDQERELIAIYASVINDSNVPLITDYDYLKVESGQYFTNVREDNEFKMWYIYKTAGGKYYTPTLQPSQLNGAFLNTGIDTLTISGNSFYNSEEEAKKSIEEYIAKYDNVKLEELEIPEALK